MSWGYPEASGGYFMNYRERLHCSSCGRFISMDEFMEGKIETEYIPDTPFTRESTTHYHKGGCHFELQRESTESC